MSTRPIRLLLVEDNVDDADLVIRQVRVAGFEPYFARVDSEADYIANLSGDLDVILCDYHLPQFSAPRALELLDQSGLSVPFIIVSGAVGEDAAVEVMRQGAHDYLLKDRLTRLGQSISAALEKSEQKRLRAVTEAQLRDSQQLFEVLAETVEQVLWISDGTRSRIHFVSPAFDRIWGRSRNSLYSDPRAWMEGVHPEDRERVLKAYVSPTPYEQEYRVVRPDGEVRWVYSKALPVRDADGVVIRVVGVATDVTERRQLESEYRHAQKMEALGQLAAGVAHDFNNLLTVIGGNAALLKMAEVSGAELRECCDEIVSATDSATNLTRQLLTFGRKNVVRRTEVDLDEVVDKFTRMLERLVGADVRLRRERDADLSLVLADTSMLEQVLLNLAVNARDAMPDGGELVITTSNRRPSREIGAWVCLTVRDNGAGIPPALVSKLFEPFFTTKEPGRGTGLGLATVFGIVQQHKGRIEVESEPGKGSAFHVFLPVSIENQASGPSPLARVTPGQGHETILVVEDESSVRLLVTRLLRRYGYTVYEAESGLGALEVWRRHAADIDLLLTDMVMPDGLTGYDLAKRLCGEKPNLKVLLTSGYSADLASRQQAWNEEYGFLQKPYDPPRLASALRQCLDRAS